MLTPSKCFMSTLHVRQLCRLLREHFSGCSLFIAAIDYVRYLPIDDVNHRRSNYQQSIRNVHSSVQILDL
jgi:hypothetical protein